MIYEPFFPVSNHSLGAQCCCVLSCWVVISNKQCCCNMNNKLTFLPCSLSFFKHTAKHKNDSFNSISLCFDDCNLLLLSFWEKICPVKTNLKTLWTQNDRWPDASHVVGGTFFICFFFEQKLSRPKDQVRVGVDRFSRMPSKSPITSEQRWWAERVQNYLCSRWFWLVIWPLLMFLLPLVSVSRLFGCLHSQNHRGDFHARSNAIKTFDVHLVGKTSIIHVACLSTTKTDKCV